MPRFLEIPWAVLFGVIAGYGNYLESPAAISP